MGVRVWGLDAMGALAGGVLLWGAGALPTRTRLCAPPPPCGARRTRPNPHPHPHHTHSLAPQHRVAEFERWLNGRREQLVVLVGHSSFWHTFTGQRRKRLANCEVMAMSW